MMVLAEFTIEKEGYYCRRIENNGQLLPSNIFACTRVTQTNANERSDNDNRW